MRKKIAFTYRKILLMALAALMICLPALAIDKIDEGAATSLTVAFAPEGTPAEGAAFALYRVADMTDFGTFTLSGAFAGYPVQVNDLDSEGWRILSGTLAGYAATDEIVPDATATVGADGKCAFTGLNVGLYLVTGEAWVGAEKVFTPQPTLVALPGRDENDIWYYDETITAKFDAVDRILTDISVMKVWSDSDYSGRPASITVELLGNGQLVDTVELNRDNNWRYTWEKLDGEMSWQVVENPVPDGYTVQVERENTLITITNSRPPQGGGDEKLPQTGQLWWPVPVLALAGMTLFAVGWIRRRAYEK